MERRTSLVARLVGGHPVVADWLLTGVVTLVALGQRFGMPERSTPVQSTALGVLFALAGSVPIAWRRRFPLQVLAITELVVLVELALGFDRVAEAGGVGPGVVVALYTVATSCPWPVSAWAAAVVVVLNTAVLLAWQLFAGGVQQDAFPALLLLGGSWLVGDNVRTRRAYTAELEERAARLEREREERAVRAVAEERARIARELHDVVAHHVSVIAVQAGAAARPRAPPRPGRARRCGASSDRPAGAGRDARHAGRAARADEAAAGARPAAGPAASSTELVDRAATAGLPVELDHGRARGCPPASTWPPTGSSRRR